MRSKILGDTRSCSPLSEASMTRDTHFSFILRIPLNTGARWLFLFVRIKSKPGARWQGSRTRSKILLKVNRTLQADFYYNAFYINMASSSHGASADLSAEAPRLTKKNSNTHFSYTITSLSLQINSLRHPSRLCVSITVPPPGAELEESVIDFIYSTRCRPGTCSELQCRFMNESRTSTWPSSDVECYIWKDHHFTPVSIAIFLFHCKIVWVGYIFRTN